VSNGKPLKDILRPIAEGLVALFYERVSQSADTANTVTWEFNHYDVRHIPLNFKAQLRVQLVYTGQDTPPHRRAEDTAERLRKELDFLDPARMRLEDLMSDRSQDA
jgi:hypothetical protein